MKFILGFLNSFSLSNCVCFFFCYTMWWDGEFRKNWQREERNKARKYVHVVCTLIIESGDVLTFSKWWLTHVAVAELFSNPPITWSTVRLMVWITFRLLKLWRCSLFALLYPLLFTVSREPKQCCSSSARKWPIKTCWKCTSKQQRKHTSLSCDDGCSLTESSQKYQ